MNDKQKRIDNMKDKSLTFVSDARQVHHLVLLNDKFQMTNEEIY